MCRIEVGQRGDAGIAEGAGHCVGRDEQYGHASGDEVLVLACSASVLSLRGNGECEPQYQRARK